MEGLNDDIRRVMARNADILECRRQLQHWTERLSLLEAEQRREYLLGAMEYDPQGTWNKLTEEEQQEKDFAVKALTCKPCVFGKDPFGPSPNHIQLPYQFRKDRDAVLAYLSSSMASTWLHKEHFYVVDELVDDTQVMTLVCERFPLTLARASPRLLNDWQFVMTALTGHPTNNYLNLNKASVQLRSNKDFMIELIRRTKADKLLGWNLWMIFSGAALSEEDEKELVLDTLGRFQHSEEKDPFHLNFMSKALRDDKKVMKQLVKENWRALQYCSDRLKSDEEVVRAAISQTIKAARYANEPFKNDWRMVEKRMVVEELEEGKLDFDEIPTEMKSDPEVIVVALKAEAIKFKELSCEHCMNRGIILAYSGFMREDDFYRLIPQDLQNDETLCLEMLKAGYDYPRRILDTVPSLYSSREAILGIIKASNGRSLITFVLPGIISVSPFRDDQEVMLSACKESPDVLDHASARLRSDQNFILDAITLSEKGRVITYTSKEFQSENIDLVVKAIKNCSGSLVHNRRFISRLARDVWRHRSIVLACLEKEWTVLCELSWGNPLLDDTDIVRAAVEISPSELRYASRRLKGDHEFVLSLVKIDGRSLAHAEAHLRNDDDILIAAVADTPSAVIDCFGSGSTEHFEFLASFASRVRSKLEIYETYLRVFLRGISVSTASAHCQLPLLERGIETSVALKKMVAQFAGVPIGAELLMLRKASTNLRKLGY